MTQNFSTALQQLLQRARRGAAACGRPAKPASGTPTGASVGQAKRSYLRPAPSQRLTPLELAQGSAQ